MQINKRQLIVATMLCVSFSKQLIPDCRFNIIQLLDKITSSCNVVFYYRLDFTKNIIAEVHTKIIAKPTPRLIKINVIKSI